MNRFLFSTPMPTHMRFSFTDPEEEEEEEIPTPVGPADDDPRR